MNISSYSSMNSSSQGIKFNNNIYFEIIKKYDCNVLIMGNDWDNKFNSPEYESIYFNRTPNISSTQLRNQLNKINLTS